MSGNAAIDWARHSGDAWLRRWRKLDLALGELAGQLDPAILAGAPNRPFQALDIGCGAGSTSLALVSARPDARIVASDISPGLVELARQRLAAFETVEVMLSDAAEVAGRAAPIDLFFSRHGVMFFADPMAAFGRLRAAAAPDATLIFSCFRSWAENPWASELAEAFTGPALPAPGTEPGGFAFADPAYVTRLLQDAGWSDPAPRAIDFRYQAGPRGEALAFFAEIGPASRELGDLEEVDRPAALDRMAAVLDARCEAGEVVFPAAAWIWTARA